MKPIFLRFSTLSAAVSVVIGAAILAGCAIPEQGKPASPATPKPTASSPAPSAPAPAPVVVPPSAAQQALTDGMDLYDKGDFNGAIKKLSGSPDIWTADKSVQLSALKTMAFSYCVSSRQTLCRQQFEKALRLDPAFDLEPGEKQHPLWAPVFEQAKKRVAAAERKAAAPARKPAAKPAATPQ
ncbi:TssQ family T6SS-associated lipoprotein [Undibacterium sp. TJN25]|uniref:TssQ family T6SS-associated lipoprotein n=1 Tax=Undibacterium sp. TJN25 TaxID=3413056 RepID=UPI003BF031F5